MSALVDRAAEGLIDLAIAADNALEPGTIVDSYFGAYEPQPPSTTSVVDIAQELRTLARRVPSVPDQTDQDVLRVADIAGTAEALATFLAAKAKRQHLDYDATASAVLGVDMAVPSIVELNESAGRLRDLLNRSGYRGGLPEALQAWRADQAISAHDYVTELQHRARRFKASTTADVLCTWLEPAEANEIMSRSVVDYQLVRPDATWSAYHYYKGDYHSAIAVNEGRATFEREDATPFAAHEVYPGHHTEALVKEYLYRKGSLGLEATIALINVPGNILSEGLADQARHLLSLPMSVGEEIAILADHLSTDWRHRVSVRAHRGEQTWERAAQELVEHLGISSVRAEALLAFTRDWRFYFPSYYLGLRFVRELLDEHGDRALLALYTRGSAQTATRACRLASTG